MDIVTISARFLVVFLMSLIFGLERQRSHKPIGFGTYIFVSIGSCGLALIAISLSPEAPLPLLGAIVTGIGFLGAGALLRTSDKIFGFTSAASIWIFSIIGVVIGIGEYFIGLILYVLIWVVILIDSFLEEQGIGSYQKRLTVVMNENLHAGQLAKQMGIKKYKILNIDINHKDKTYTLTLNVEGHKKNINSIPRVLNKLNNINSFRID